MKSQINIEIELDEEKMPETISWNAPGGGVDDFQKAKGVLLGLWDGDEKSALRIDLWTKKMMVDEMNDFFYQSFYGMAETYARATRNDELAKEIREFAKEFHRKAADALNASNENDTAKAE